MDEQAHLVVSVGFQATSTGFAFAVQVLRLLLEASVVLRLGVFLA